MIMVNDSSSALVTVYTKNSLFITSQKQHSKILQLYLKIKSKVQL